MTIITITITITIIIALPRGFLWNTAKYVPECLTYHRRRQLAVCMVTGLRPTNIKQLFFYFFVLQILGRRTTAQKLLRLVAKDICIMLYMSQKWVWNTAGMIQRGKHGTLLEWYREGNTEKFGEKPDPSLLCPPQNFIWIAMGSESNLCWDRLATNLFSIGLDWM